MKLSLFEQKLTGILKGMGRILFSVGVLLIKKDVIENWMRVTRKNYLWIAREYGNVSPSYISQLINNRTNIAGNFVGFILDKTQLRFEDLFYYARGISSRDFFGKEIYFDGQFVRSAEYGEKVKGLLEEKTV